MDEQERRLVTGTGAVRRKVTNARKLGWEDPDRLSPTHDAIVHWLEEQRDTLVALWWNDPVARGQYWATERVGAERATFAALRDEAVAALRAQYQEAERRFDAKADETPEQPGWYDDRYMASEGKWQSWPAYHRQGVEEEREAALAPLREAIAHVRDWDALADVPREIAAGSVTASEWERPIMHASGNSVVGFVDYFLQCEDVPHLGIEDRGSLVGCRMQGRGWCAPLINRVFGRAPGGLEVVEEREGRGQVRCIYHGPPTWLLVGRPRRLCIEVKAEIAQVSEVLRQLQFYKVYQPGPWAVATPSWTHARTLLEQGIGFIPYTPGAPPRVYRPDQVDTLAGTSAQP